MKRQECLLKFTLFCCFIFSSCDTSKFDEHPPNQTKKEQEMIVAKFREFLYGQHEVNPADSSVINKMWRLRYYVVKDQRQYYLITHKGNFFSSGLICYGGEMMINESDTTFDVRFTIESYQINWQDSVKLSFEGMLNTPVPR